MPMIANRRSYCTQIIEKGLSVKWNLTLRFFNDLELCACIVWVT